MKKVETISKKIITLFLIVCMISIYFPSLTLISFADNSITALHTPTNVLLDDNYNATWSVDKSDLANIKYFALYYKIKYNSSIKTGYLGLFDPSSTPQRDPEYGMTIIDGKATANIKSKLARTYKELRYNGQTIEISYYVVAQADNNSAIYLDSDNSEYSNTNYYSSAGKTKIDNIFLSPNKPVIAVGRNIYIGKTIDPESAIYDKIIWSTSDDSIVSINNMGQITGMKKGNATITAKINNATQDADVSVYEIESNINNTEQATAVINEANDAIEAITKNEDISNIDIIDKESALKEIEQGAQNGDMFSVDVKYDKKNAMEYNEIKDIIKSKYEEYDIAGGNDIKIAISHTDDKGAEHHIANITELESKINVEFDIPNNLPELDKTKQREYKLVRYHNENIEDIGCEINNGKIETSSDKFSDFVVLYKDTKIYLKGDVNGDGKVNIKDWNRMYEHISGKSKLNEEELYRADVNDDGKVNIKDWNRLYEHISGKKLLW